LTLAIDGSGAPGFVKATAQIRLAAKGEQTELSGEGEGSVGGIVAAVGSRLIEAAAKKMSTDFFTRLAAQLTSSRAS
jgi:carbon monoxide dehydrogenase subunit G